MTTTAQYAAMAGDSYISNYGLINRFPVPPGWQEIPQSYISILSSGFEAISLQNQSNSNEIVISFAGTNFTSLADWTSANVPLAFGFDATQLKNAADYYLKVQSLNPNAVISFTGHSLGGGLAALMAVMFDKTAVTFDQAPFARSATAAVAQDLLTYLQGENKYTALDLRNLTNFISAANSSLGSIPNAFLVTDFNTQGEVLGYLPFSRIGKQTDISQQNNINALSLPPAELHSQALLTAFLQSNATSPTNQTLNEVTFQLTDLLKMVLDDSQLYSSSPSTNNENFLQNIILHQDGSAATIDPLTGQTQAALPADYMVTRFTTDLWLIAQAGGLTMADKNVSDALIAFAMQSYYEGANLTDLNDPNHTKQLFTAVSGGIEFAMADVTKSGAVSLGETKGYTQYFNNIFYTDPNFTYLSSDERAKIKALLPTLRDWYIQAGATGLYATDLMNQGAFMLGGTGNNVMGGGTGNDLLVAGMSGSDTLNGGAGNNTLIAGSGNDFLVGGQGNDTLYGGKGFDTFNYAAPNAGTTTETIIGYATGTGKVEVNGAQLTGGAAVREKNQVWTDSSGDQAANDASYGNVFERRAA